MWAQVSHVALAIVTQGGLRNLLRGARLTWGTCPRLGCCELAQWAKRKLTEGANTMADHSRAELIKAFARDRGLSLRGAQWNAKNETDKWRAWLAVQSGAPAAKVVEFELEVPVGEKRAKAVRARRGAQVAAEFGDPVHVEREHWEMWQDAVNAVEGAENPLVRAALMKAAIEARKAYEDAKRARIQAQIASRELVPAREFAEFRERVAVICALIERGGPDIAPVGNPENPVLVIRAWADWLQHRFNPQVQELMAA